MTTINHWLADIPAAITPFYTAQENVHDDAIDHTPHPEDDEWEQAVLPWEGVRYRAFEFFHPYETKVVILGQDPYPTPGHAHGLAFSVNPRVRPLPPSLRNIFRELVDDIGCPPPDNGDLAPWANQGVLLLNSALTVRPFQPGSHKDMGWHEFTAEILKWLSTELEQRVFILWGRHAQSFQPFINQEQHLVVASSHPSPFSASHGFFGSRPFSRTNAYLDSPINWSLSDASGSLPLHEEAAVCPE